MTALELKELIEKELSVLNGKNIKKESDRESSFFLRDEMKKILNNNIINIINFTNYGISLSTDGYNIFVYSGSIDDDLLLGSIFISWKRDKRTYNGFSSIIERVNFRYEKEIPDDFDIINLSQKLSYDYAEYHYYRLKKEIEELENEIKDRKNGMKKFKEVMDSEKYK